jgi:hypothetical protein
MSITLNDGTMTIALSDDMEWQDEFGWQKVVQAVSNTLTGALIVESAVKKTGQPITLAGGDSQNAYGVLSRADLKTVQAWSEVPGQTLTLTLRGNAYTVMFRHQEAPALSAKAFAPYSDPIDSDFYVVTLKLMVIS